MAETHLFGEVLVQHVPLDREGLDAAQNAPHLDVEVGRHAVERAVDAAPAQPLPVAGPGPAPGPARRLAVLVLQRRQLRAGHADLNGVSRGAYIHRQNGSCFCS